MLPLTFTRFVDITPTIRTFYFYSEQPIDYQAGQFTKFYLPHKADDKGEFRDFTLSSSPTEEELAITVRKPPLCSSFKAALWQLQPGDLIRINEPMGDFVLPLDTSVPLIWIAGGIGITPFRSMATWLADTHGNRPIHLIHATKNDQDHIFTDHIGRLPLVSSEHLITSSTIRLNADTVLELIPQSQVQEAFVYVSGPEPMVRSMTQDLVSCGIVRERIITDAFLGYKDPF